MDVTEGSILEQMALSDIVMTTILLKTGDQRFKEEALAYGFKKLSQTYPRFCNLFYACGDGTSPESNTALENTLSFLQMGRILEDTKDLQHMYMTNFGRRVTHERLREYSHPKILDELRPISDEVWRHAKEYR